MVKELQEYKHWCWNCFRDSVCKHVFMWHLRNADYDDICPSLARYKFDAYAAQGKMGEIARAMLEGELKWSDKLLHIIYEDPICGACDYNCGRVMEMQPTQVIQALRVKAIRDGMSPPGELKPFLDDLRKNLNPYRKRDAERANWLKGLPSELAGETASPKNGSKTKMLLFAGCSTMRDPQAEKMPQTAVSLILKAGGDLGVLNDLSKERCCGNPSLRMGDMDQFVAFAKENIKIYNEMGIDQLVTTCPFCYSTFRRDYADVGDKMNFEVVHILDLVDRLIKEGKLKPTKPINMTVTYHDPCHTGRMSSAGLSGTGDFTGIYQQPRDIIKSIPGMRLVEMNRTKDDNFCCGGGSWMKYGSHDFAQWTATQRIEEARSTGAEAIVTYCPHCEENLGEALTSQGNKMKIYNLLDLVWQSL